MNIKLIRLRPCDCENSNVNIVKISDDQYYYKCSGCNKSSPIKNTIQTAKITWNSFTEKK